jgi:hypothetical protein
MGTFDGALCSTEAVLGEDGMTKRLIESESEDDEDGEGDDERMGVSGEDGDCDGDGDGDGEEGIPSCALLLVRSGVATVGFRRDRLVTGIDECMRDLVRKG